MYKDLFRVINNVTYRRILGVPAIIVIQNVTLVIMLQGNNQS